MRPGLDAGVLAEEVVLLDRGHRGVRVRAADHAELERVHAEFPLQQQAVLERLAGVFVLQHLGLLGLGAVEVGLVPLLVVGELVVGREERVRFAVALDLGGLDERLEPGPHRRQLLGERLAVEGLHREHAAVAQIAVVRDGQHLRPGLLFELGQILPEVFRILAVELGERQRCGSPRWHCRGRARCGAGCCRRWRSTRSR